jgi:hypothetical protein
VYNKKKSKVTVQHVYRLLVTDRGEQDEEEQKKKAEHIVNSVLERIDLDKDGRISADELEKVGLDGLPNFEGAEGHHYDVESGMYLYLGGRVVH